MQLICLINKLNYKLINMKLYKIYDTQNQFYSYEVLADTLQEAKKLYCDYLGLNRLLYVDRIKGIEVENIN